MPKIRILVYVLTCVLSYSVYGQNIMIKGKVLDAKYKTPVPYAAIYIHNTPNGTISDNVGEFSFEAPISLKESTLVIARQKYKLQYIELVNQLNSDFLVFLEPDNFELLSKNLQDSLNDRSNKIANTINSLANFVKDDWIPLGNPESYKFDFGRIQTLPTYNPIEGLRLRMGIASNGRLSPNIFINSYIAYGLKDHKWKYRGELSYSFDKKAYHENEFPKNKVSLVYENDIYSPGEMHPLSPNNMLLITFRRSENEATYRNFGEIYYEREYKNGISHTFNIRKSRLVPQGNLRFEQLTSDITSPNGELRSIDNQLNTLEAGVHFRYSAREAYEQQKRRRRPIEMESPVFFLSHSVGTYEQFNKTHNYHRSELSIQKRFQMGSAGRVDAVGEVMKVWNSVPFPLLVYPNQRIRHHIENNAFFLNRALEFVADEQYTMRFTFVGDDLILSKVPILDKFSMKELMSVRASYGKLNDRNRPTSGALYDFPERSFEYGSVPYIEGAIGVTNILGLVRIEYVHRFTYRDHPEALLGKIRFDVTL